jgi:hypothetical protein
VNSNFTGNLVLTVSDSSGKALCRMDLPKTPGVDRVNWNLRVEPQPSANAGQGGRGGGGGGGGGRGRGNAGPTCIDVNPPAPAPAPTPALAPDPNDPNAAAAAAAAFQFAGGGRGGPTPFVPNGHYMATLGTKDGDKVTPIGKVQWFQVVPLPAKNW